MAWIKVLKLIILMEIESWKKPNSNDSSYGVYYYFPELNQTTNEIADEK